MKQNQIINGALNNDELIARVRSIKNGSEYLEILLRFEAGDVVVNKDAILDMQNTTRENYPQIILAYITDVNKSTSLILKAIKALYENDEGRTLFASEIKIAGHTVRFNESGEFISADAEKAFEDYFSVVKKHIYALNDFLQKYSHINGIDYKELHNIKSIVSNIAANFQKSGMYQAYLHPTFFGYDLKNAFPVLQEQFPEISETAKFFQRPIYQSAFYQAYFSCNLHDFKMVPKKSIVYTLGDHFPYEFVAKEAGTVGRSMRINSIWEPDFTIDYFLKKHLVEVSSGKSFFEVMGAFRDYLARDKFLASEKNWNEKHPFVIESRIVEDFESQIGNVRDSYDLFVSKLHHLFISKNQLTPQEWISALRPLGSNGDIPLPSACKLAEPCSSRLYLKAINDWSQEKIKMILEAFVGNDAFIRAKEEELYVSSAIVNILEHFYSNNISQEYIGTIEELPSYRDRATFHTTMATSLVFDFRKNVAIPMSDAAKQYLETSEEVRDLYKVMENHPYHDFFELDVDFLGKKSTFNAKDLMVFLEGIKRFNLPVRYKSGFKLRKLGNYKAYGIYFSHSRMLGIDFRDGKYSYVHEMAHHIDLNKRFKERRDMVIPLWRYFDNRITERRDYYLKSEELIARAAEVSMILKASGYRMLAGFRGQPEVMIAKMRDNYAQSMEAQFMKDWDTYAQSINHVNIEDEIRRKRFTFLDQIDQYFSVFWGWDSPVVTTDEERVSSAGKGHYGDNPYSDSHHSFDYYMRKIYSLNYGEFDEELYTQMLVDFILDDIPMAQLSSVSTGQNTSPFNQEYVDLLKRYWGAFIKKGEQQLLASVSEKPEFYFNDQMAQAVQNDFEKRFGDEPNYGAMKQSLEKMFDILADRGYKKP